jgi:hypothetical protein
MATFLFRMLGYGLVRMADGAALDAYSSNTCRGAVESLGDIGAYTGLTAYNGMYGDYIKFEHFDGAYYPDLSKLQRLQFVDKTGDLVTLERSKAWVAPASEPAYSAWAVV